ncbi:putative alpha-glucan lyase [Diplodia seriata]|uniref:Putative alpha-glucan lyase n=1 Tax=Diplodia seriata TaxID=420778 RepID=A0A0G2F190_9PEZI|nr:putative alpha-glucan lyase [Diplodia seriata]
MVRNDILVAPQLEQKQARREIYFPSTTAWFPMNLRPHDDDAIGEALQPSVPGGCNVSFDCHIAPEDGHLPHVCPMYIREGAIIPQIQVRDSVPDRTRPELPAAAANPITINIYPGHSSRGPSKYSMYLDDGVSRSSAPDDAYLFLQPADGVDEAGARPNNEYGDRAARSNFRRVDVEQNVVEDADGDRVTGRRRITLSTGWKGVGEGVRRGDDVPDAERYDDEQVERDVGAEYRLVVWHEPQTDMAGVAVNVLRGGGGIRVGEDDVGKKASVVWVPTRKDVEAVIEVVYQ